MMRLPYMYNFFIFFFFSSRRRHTRYWRDWSSDVCSSDLKRTLARAGDDERTRPLGLELQEGLPDLLRNLRVESVELLLARSEERRVGSVDLGGRRIIKKKNKIIEVTLFSNISVRYQCTKQ